MEDLIQEIRDGKKLDIDEFIRRLGRTFDLLNQLESTPQDPIWHAEGNVKIHTGMVLEETYRLLEPGGAASHLSEDMRLALVLSAVFHDAGKTVKTREEEIDGKIRITSPRHAKWGRSWLARNIRELGLDYHIVFQILGCVGHHHDPKSLIMKRKGEYKYRRLARHVDLEMVYLLEIADCKGRISKTGDDTLEDLELLKLSAEEFRLWRNSDPYADWREHIHSALDGESQIFRDLALQQGIRDAEASVISTPHEAIARALSWKREKHAHLIILCGPSGSGKSSYIQSNHPDANVVSLDQWRLRLTGKISNRSKEGEVAQAAKKELRKYLRAGETVIWDATSLTEKQRVAIVQLGLNYRAFVTIVAFHLTEEMWRKRNRAREHFVGEKVISRQFEMLEWPFVADAHEVKYVDEKGGELHFGLQQVQVG